MIRSLVDSSLRFRLLLIPAAIAVLVLGGLQLREARVDVLPEFTPPYVEIQTEALGLSAPEVEALITVPMEGDLLNGVAGIDAIRSESVPGLSSVVLVFEPGTDLLDARQLVQERLTRAHDLPNVSRAPAMLQPLSSASRVQMIGLSSDELSLVELGILARWTIRPRLLGVPGVANVAIWGQREHQLQVRVDPERLRRHDLTLQQIVSTTGNSQLVSPLTFLEASTPGTGGFIDTPNQRLQVRHILPIADPQGLAQVPVEGAPAKRLGDVVEIVEDHQPLIGDAALAEGSGLLLVVEKFPGASTLEVARGIEDALDALRPGLRDVEVDATVFRSANSVEAAIDNLTVAVLAGLVLLAAALTVFLGWRAALVAVASVVLSLVVAAFVLTLAGQTINALVLAGLGLALMLVVADAVGSASRLIGRLEAEGRARSPAAVVRDAAADGHGALAFGAVVALVAIAPLLFLEGTVGAFFRPLVVAYALAIVASVAVAVSVTPALSLLVLARSPDASREPRATGWIRSRVGSAVPRLRRWTIPAIAVVGALGVGSAVALTQLDRSVVPAFEDSELLIRVDGAPGTSRVEMVRITDQLSRELRALDGVRNAGGHVGRAVMADQIAGINAAELWVSLDEDVDHEATVSAIGEVLAGYPGLDRELITYSGERIRAVGSIADGHDAGLGGVDALAGAGDPLVVRVYGKDLGVLREKASEVRDLLRDVDGVVEPRVEPQVEEPTIEIEVDLAAARRHGLRPGDVRRAAATLVQGIEVGSLFEEQKVFEVVVRGTPQAAHSVSSVRNLRIDTPAGGRVRLDDVAHVRIAPSPTVIRREAASRRIDVTADVRGRDLEAVIDDVERRLVGIEFPLEYHAEVLEDSAGRAASGSRLAVAAFAAVVAILLVLQVALGSWRLAALFLLALPLALAGGVIAAALAGEGLSLGSFLGLLALFLLAARGATEVAGAVRPVGRGQSRTTAIERAAADRAPELLTTAGAIALAVLPLIVTGDVSGQEILHPLAVVVLGGLVTALPVTLLLIPALYARFAPDAEPETLEFLEQPAAS